jgi:hypothetical protein
MGDKFRSSSGLQDGNSGESMNKAANDQKDSHPKEAQEQPKPKLSMGELLDSALAHNSDGDGAVIKRYQATPEETRARDIVLARRRQKTPRIQVIKTESEGKCTVGWSVNHPNEGVGHYLLMNALGTSDTDFYTAVVTDFTKAATRGREVDESAVNFMIATLKAMEPKDELEILLGVQLAMTHILSVDFARRLNSADGNIPERDSLQNGFNKLSRTFISQLEALKRYRSTGQKVTVEHIQINNGNAIVGNVSTGGGRGSSEKAGITP